MPRVSASDLRAAKDTVIAAIGAGKTVKEATAAAGRSVKTFEGWRKQDPEFAARVDEVREAFRRRGESGAAEVVAAQGRRDMSFEAFRKEFLGRDTYDHQRAWICALEGRELDEGLPGELELNNPRRLIVNTPPGHSKSTVITVEYVVYRLCMNPDTHAVIVGKTQEKAKKFLHSIKQRLTDPRWAKLQAAFAPEGGFKQPGNVWSSTMIYIGQPVASEEKDPNVQAIGIRGDLQGARVQLMILDDAVDMHNANLWEGQKAWLDDIVQSRLYNGKLVVVGTRAAAQDLYAALMDGSNYLSGRSQWSRLKQAAVSKFAADPKDWVTLWPRSTQPYDPDDTESVPGEDGLFPAFDGPKLAEIRGSIAANTWSFLYQQEDVAEDSVFKPVCVHGSVDRRRKPGPLKAGAWGHPRAGKEGMYTIASMDPAMAGDTFVVVESVDRVERRRWVENAFVETSPSPEWIRHIIREVTVDYGVNEWVIESNAFQLFLVHDPEIRTFLASMGVRLSPHYTSGNKQDPDFGVASLGPLFGTTRRISDGSGREVFNGDNLIELPDPDYSIGVKTLIEELLTWVPGKRGKDLRMDGPMALWFAELRARNILGVEKASNGQVKTHFKNPFLTRRDRKQQAVVPAHLLEGGVYGR